MLDKSMPVIRRARHDEIPWIVDLTKAALEGFRGIVPDRPLDLYIDYSCDVAGRWDGGDVLVVETEGRIEGTVTHADRNRDDDALPPEWATFRSLMVHPASGGHGMGRLLVDHCIDAARRSGAPALGIHTADFMTAARRIYDHAGFSRCPEHDFLASSFFGFDPAGGDILVTAYRLDL
jgi:GNAT superfamily N-acetyltransferase